jgi:hypothetical protein
MRVLSGTSKEDLPESLLYLSLHAGKLTWNFYAVM